MKNVKLIIKLLKIVEPLKYFMCLAVIFGTIGNLLAMAIPTLGAFGISNLLIGGQSDFKFYLIILVVIGFFRSILKYLEQLTNHYIAFKTLHIIRDKVFTSMRRLTPAKLDSKDSGELIALITSDIELLEVFYAHTISPVLIAILCEIALIYTLAKLHLTYVLILLVFHFFVGIVIPFTMAHFSKGVGLKERAKISKLNTKIYEIIGGLVDLVQFDTYLLKFKEVENSSKELFDNSYKASKLSGINFGASSFTIMICNIVTLMASGYLYINDKADILTILVGFVLVSSSFGPVLAISNLANDLRVTFACAKRVIGIIEEEPIVEENFDGKEFDYENMLLDDISFKYKNNAILENFSLKGEQKGILGVFGKSGSGKSTILKLIMRFYDVDSGKIAINDNNIKDIKTASLRKNQSYLTQSTYLFNDSIEENIKIAKPSATRDEIIEACKKASIHDFIMQLPQGYDTIVKRDSSNFSQGEIQRMGMARTFLHDGKLNLLDEPTSNIDALNEAIILKSIIAQSKDRFFVLVSHRLSTLGISDDIFYMEKEK